LTESAGGKEGQIRFEREGAFELNCKIWPIYGAMEPHQPVTIRVPSYMPNMDAGRLAPSMDVVWCASEPRILHLYSPPKKSPVSGTGNLLTHERFRLCGTYKILSTTRVRCQGLGFSVKDLGFKV